MTQPLFDVIATNMKTLERRIIAHSRSRESADALLEMTVARRGVEAEFFTVEPAQ